MRRTCRSTTVADTSAIRRPERLRSWLAGLVLALLAAPWARAEVLTRVVVRVNDRITTLEQFNRQLDERNAAIEHSQLQPDEQERARKRAPGEVLRSILEEMLLLSRADQLHVRASESDLEGVISDIQSNNQFASREELMRAVAQTGETWDAFKRRLGDQQRIQEVVGREVNGQLKLDEDNLRIYYRDHAEQFRVPEERKLAEIVVLDSSPLTAAERTTLANDLSRRLSAGEKADEIVKNTSEKGLTSGVIALDWVPKGDLDPGLEAAIEGLGPGKASAPVAGRGGLHIVQVLESRASHLKTFDEVKDQIWRRERERLFEKEFPKYLQTLEQRSYVVINPPAGAENFRRAAAEHGAEDDPLSVFKRKQPAGKHSTKDATPPKG